MNVPYWLVPLLMALITGAVLEASVLGVWFIFCGRRSDREARARRDVRDLERAWGPK